MPSKVRILLEDAHRGMHYTGRQQVENVLEDYLRRVARQAAWEPPPAAGETTWQRILRKHRQLKQIIFGYPLRLYIVRDARRAKWEESLYRARAHPRPKKGAKKVGVIGGVNPLRGLDEVPQPLAEVNLQDFVARVAGRARKQADEIRDVQREGVPEPPAPLPNWDEAPAPRPKAAVNPFVRRRRP